MKEMDEREERWTAYYLGESSPEEKEAIEAELRENPEAQKEFDRLIVGVKGWAKEPVASQPLDVSHFGRPDTPVGLENEIGSSSGKRIKRANRPLSLAIGIAAAALFVFALSQIQFSLQFGETAFVWGKSLSSERLDDLQAQVGRNAIELEQVELWAAGNTREIKDIVLTNLAMRDIFAQSTAQLVRMQEVESQTRYKDMKSVLTLVGHSPATRNPWAETPTFSDGANGKNGVIEKSAHKGEENEKEQ